jgi:hypothetical protein
MAYLMPISADDLGFRERFDTFKHAAGVQGEGKDIGVRRRDSDSNWPQLTVDGANPKVLTNWITYGVSFYAMAAGTVVGGWRNAPENIPFELHEQYLKGKFAGGGNHLWILQDDGLYALYAHAKKGSIPPGLCPHNAPLFTGVSNPVPASPNIESECAITNGARVEAGQFLGRIGNSGNTSEPHLHVHMEAGGLPKPMSFERGMTTSFAGGSGSLKGPWKKVAGNTLPNSEILVWAPRSIGNYTWNGIPKNEFQGLFDHMFDSGMMPTTVTCQNNGATYDSTWVPSHGEWLCFFGMSAAGAAQKHSDLTKQGFVRTWLFTCGTKTSAIWRK